MSPAKKSIDDLPAVVFRSRWRTVLATLVVWTPSLAVSGYVAFVLGWQPLGPSWLVNLATMAFVASLLISWTMSAITGRVFRHLGAAYHLIAQQKYQEALVEMEKNLAFVEQHPWLDHWRTVLFLYVQKHSLHELAWANIGFVHMRSGDLAKGRAAYEKCLAIAPCNELAIDNLNFAAAFAGEPIRPGGSGLTFCHAIDFKQARRQSNIIFIGAMAIMLGLVPFAGSLVTMLVWDVWNNAIAPLMPDGSWYLKGILIGLVLFFLLRFAMMIYHLAATRMVLFDLYRANRLAKAGRYHDTIKALEMQRSFFDEHPWIDTLRWVLLFSPTTYSYREWVLISLADVYLDLGDTNKYIDYNQECLIQNPANAFARSRLEFCNTILGSLNKPLVALPAG